MRRADPTDLILDHRLVAAALWTALAVGLVAAAVGGLAQGGPGALGALWGAAAVGGNGAAAAWVSARTGRTRRAIGPGWVVAALPVRLGLLAAALAVAVGPLGLPGSPVALAACACEVCVIVAQSRLVLRGPSFVGPLDGRT